MTWLRLVWSWLLARWSECPLPVRAGLVCGVIALGMLGWLYPDLALGSCPAIAALLGLTAGARRRRRRSEPLDEPTTEEIVRRHRRTVGEAADEPVEPGQPSALTELGDEVADRWRAGYDGDGR